MESFGLFNFLKTMLFSANSGNDSPVNSSVSAQPSLPDSPEPPSDHSSSATEQTKNVPSDETVEQNAFLLFMDAHERRAKKIRK